MAARTLACVLLDFFIATAEIEQRPTLRGKPVVVGGDPKQRGLVVGASPEAMGMGVVPGMLTWEALRCCPQATVIAPHPDLYHDKSLMAQSVLGIYSDHIEHSQLDCFYLTIPGNDRDLVAGMQQQLAEQIGVSASIGVAANKLVAHTAARLHAPGGLEIVPAGQEASFLAPLPVEWLAGGDKVRTLLARLGLRTIGDLARVPEHLLVAQVGEAGKALLRHAQGKDARAIRSTHDREAVEREHIFDHAMNEREALRRWVAYLSAQVGQDVRAHQENACSLTLTLGHLDTAPTVLTVVLPKASNLDHTLRQAAFHLLSAWDGRAGVASLGLEARIFSDEPGFQLNIFDQSGSDWEEDQHRLDKAKNGINKRYGQGAVMAAMMLDDDILADMGKQRRKK
jgi:DNA polymerase-4